mmetsp:Transcript_14047/g.32364  ORF Transcript_14047/g.32364 Transcript_14047/m.32364 type:complete len:548 (-) Transcript_14047:156-1799(-)
MLEDLEEELDRELSMHSRATTVAQSNASSPRQNQPSSVKEDAHVDGWKQISDKLIDLALGGDEDVMKYGDLIVDEKAIRRFLAANKGNVDKALHQFVKHLKWRQDYQLDTIVDEDFSDMLELGEIYWAGKDLEGVPTLTWLLRKHDAKRQDADRFVRFLVFQIERGLRALPDYPNGRFNIAVDLSQAGYSNMDHEMSVKLQVVLTQNYPKVRKALYVFPVNWFVQLFWDTLLKPILSTLQPDIEDKICPLRGDYRAELLKRFDISEIEIAFGGELDIEERRNPKFSEYVPKPFCAHDEHETEELADNQRIDSTMEQVEEAMDKKLDEEADSEYNTPATSPVTLLPTTNRDVPALEYHENEALDASLHREAEEDGTTESNREGASESILEQPCREKLLEINDHTLRLLLGHGQNADARDAVDPLYDLHKGVSAKFPKESEHGYQQTEGEAFDRERSAIHLGVREGLHQEAGSNEETEGQVDGKEEKQVLFDLGMALAASTQLLPTPVASLPHPTGKKGSEENHPEDDNPLEFFISQVEVFRLLQVIMR